MPKFLEKKLRAEYGNNPHAIYGTMNKIGAMHGNKETAKGREMERKHEKDMKHELHHIEIHPAENGGHTVQHHFKHKTSKSGAYMSAKEPEHHVFGAQQHGEMVAHLKDALQLESAKTEAEEGSDNMKADHEGEEL